MLPRIPCYILLLVGVVAFGVPAVRAEVIISEIMYNPQGTDLDTTVTPNIYREWAELFNNGPTAVDISGWLPAPASGRSARWW
jgi:hypothetical protein